MASSSLRTLRIGLRLLAASLSGQLTYRRSFVLETVGRFAITFLELVAILVLFEHIDSLAGWTRWEVAYLYGIASLSLGLAELGTDGLNDMPELVRRGTLDALLVRPVSPLVQVLGGSCRPFHLGRVLQGALATVLALSQLGIHPSVVGGAALLVNVASTTLVFAATFLAGAATLIYTVQSAEAFNAFTYGGVQMAEYPLPIYPAWLRTLFLFVVPVGFTTYFPALIVLGRPDALGFGPAAPWLAPVVALAFAGVALAWWEIALRNYQSTGS